MTHRFDGWSIEDVTIENADRNLCDLLVTNHSETLDWK